MHRRRAGNIPAMIETRLTAISQRSLNCARCGTAFTCGAGGDDGRCWCAAESFRIPMPADAAEDCLCPTCLQAHAASLAEQRS